MTKRKNILIPGWLLGVIFCLAIVALLILLFRNDTPSTNDKETLSGEMVIQKNPDSIAIPGYEILELDADSKTQTLCLSNPTQNACYFQISLYLEDNTLLWKSELIEPGKNSEPIVLTQVLGKGTYNNTTLKYECFQMDGNTPLNGAETKLTLWVK